MKHEGGYYKKVFMLLGYFTQYIHIIHCFIPSPYFPVWNFLAQSHCLQTSCKQNIQGCSCQKVHLRHRILPCCIAQHVLTLPIHPKFCRQWFSFLSVFHPTWRLLHSLLGTWNPYSWSYMLHNKCRVHTCGHQRLWLCNFFLF